LGLGTPRLLLGAGNWADGVYLWHAGYWGPRVGFYGGINYGFGYIGTGYFGGFWDHDRFHYNRAVNNFGNVHVTNVYNRTVVNNINITRNTNIVRTSFNGGKGGINAQPNAAERQAAQERRTPPTSLQAQHEQRAASNHGLLASSNHGRPSIAATPRPAAFTAHGTVGARGGASQHSAHPTPHQQVQGAAARPPRPGNDPHGPSHVNQNQAAHPQGPGGPRAAGPHGAGPHDGGHGPHGGGHDEHGGGEDHGHGPH
jgi:hypothetical protein